MGGASQDCASETLALMKMTDLRAMAKDLGLIGYSRLRKQDLIKYLERKIRADAKAEAGLKSKPKLPGLEFSILSAEPAPTSSAAAPISSSIKSDELEASPVSEPGDMRDASWYPPELPTSYGKDRLTVMVRDPHWLFCYWEVSDAAISRATRDLTEPWRKVLRVHLLGDDGAVIDGWEYGVAGEVDNWYVNSGRPGASFKAELGLKDAEGRYRTLVVSHSVTAPNDTPSERWDEEWVGLSRETWEELERAARPFPASMWGADSIKRELKSIAGEGWGSEVFFSSKAKKVRSSR